MDNDSVKDNIRNFRKRHRLTQSEMADKLGISRTAYRNIEMGETRLISENIEKIAGILEMDTAELVLGYAPYAKGRSEEGGGQTLKDIRIIETEKRYREENERMAAEIARLENKVTLLQQHLDTLKELIKTKDQIISMMKKLDSKDRTE